MKALFILNDPPYGTERFATGHVPVMAVDYHNQKVTSTAPSEIQT